MCLLITQNKNAPALKSEWLEDFFSYNSDGVGVMYAHKGNLVIEKLLPKTAIDLEQFYDAHIQNRNCAWHLRMRTHGDIDLDNCHPYQVLNKKEHGLDMWLMHNGILSTGNKANPKKSDTWHYIKDYLVPMLAKNPDFAFHPAFNLIVADHIGKSNKFVIMDNTGRMATINKDAGVYWNGIWLSNTYAWSASSTASKKLITDKKKLAKQALEMPVIVQKQYDMDYGYNYGYAYSGTSYKPDIRDDEDVSYYMDEIEQIFMDFEDRGLLDAVDINPDVIYDFIDEFSYDCFLEIAYMCLDGAISEEWYVKCIRNYQNAREAFPWLDRVAGNDAYNSHGVNTKNTFNTKEIA